MLPKVGVYVNVSVHVSVYIKFMIFNATPAEGWSLCTNLFPFVCLFICLLPNYEKKVFKGGRGAGGLCLNNFVETNIEMCNTHWPA